MCKIMSLIHDQVKREECKSKLIKLLEMSTRYLTITILPRLNQKSIMIRYRNFLRQVFMRPEANLGYK